ncbi:DNA-3-methyladenine glycosylase I [Labedella endophytica]|uniref:DNA-3-methyladenine glycosylase I n=1 Tax=Labedella endophytica TaxID=1523160 RepID=A0A433JTA4_9MICO|nr:DNA-3-methyladenine glycosylase I [Labedella endophytica]RUR01154.1 DNA-3-methyladenine glycosylase I [Labedella endophytica]
MDTPARPDRPIPDATATPVTPPRPALVVGADGRSRCSWCGDDPEYQRYHDEEWGRPLRGDRAVFEKISLEAFQSGLSWITILRRRPGFRTAFADFDLETVARMDDDDVVRLMGDAAIIRNRRKIEATIGNARAALALEGSLSDLVWSFAPNDGDRPRPRTWDDIDTTTPASHALSSELRARGFRFVGPTTMHALMQSGGLVDDHFEGCWRAGDPAA